MTFSYGPRWNRGIHVDALYSYNQQVKEFRGKLSNHDYDKKKC